ncbi:MAG TPA: septal ring lytic transglycosylase RlpA family protein [Solirubrobacteraceae bacterium]|nr:septal ring lytic transglycosylase RlpA family protein [Solirubrobacteraceae bacterium]
MRRRTILREPRLVHAAVGTMILAGPVSAALAASPNNGAAAPDANQALQDTVQSPRVGYGRPVVVRGYAPASDSGQTVTLSFAPTGRSSWQQIASSQIGSGGSFRLSTPLWSSGQIKVTTESPSAGAFAAAASSSSTQPQRVAVAAAIRLARRTRTVLGAGTLQVRGELLPHVAGRRVELQAHRGGRWVTLGTATTRTNGRFAVRSHVNDGGHQPLRIRFAGDRENAAISKPAGRLTVLSPSTASWYDDAGTTACGFHATYGVANLSLPCGTHVTFRYGGRTVTATVDDRGPYVGGREWDLNQNTAAALGFAGVATVWTSS